MSSFVVCPACRGDLARTPETLDCRRCERQYPITEDVPQFDLSGSDSQDPELAAKADRRAFWDEGWKSRVQHDHAFLSRLQSRSEWDAVLERTIQRYKDDRYMTAVEAGQDVVRGKVVLDIGCGSGQSGPIFAYYGAHYIGLDHSRHAAICMRRYLKSAGRAGFTVQGNADSLPIREGSIDVVFSNGVLHHTPKFLQAMDEVYRVLKPGGRAAISLYSTYSTQFLATRLLGALRGHVSAEAMERWMSAQTEGDWRTGTRLNPWTETFTKARLRGVVSKYNVQGLVLRKQGHPVGEVPRYGQRLMRSRLMRGIDRMLEPLLGDMLIMSFTK